MFNVENISNKLADKIVREVNGDDERKAVIAYGIFGMLQIGISILLVIIFGALFNIMIEALIMSFTISILRKYSGGVHASTPTICTIVGTLICIIVPLLISKFLIKGNWVLIFGVIVFCISYCLIYKLAPVDSINKPIKKLERRKKLKRKSMIILTTYLIIVIILLFLYKELESGKLLLYCMCIYAGILWQIFSLTKLGHVVLGRLDFIFNKINIFITRRV